MNHLFISLPNPDSNFIKELKSTMFNFIWGGKVDKIKREVSVLQYDEGGLKFLDLECYIASLKSTWIRRYITSDSKWKNILDCLINMNQLIQCGTEFISLSYQNTNNQFWKDTLQSWKLIADTLDSNDKENCNILHSPIWYNHTIIVNNQYVFFKKIGLIKKLFMLEIC